ncbi:membrane protein of unknown function [Shewanella benthica]|uniref:Uncharacterized protein n=1 Tax=Shewanella benthica TaxID=43661 RepID=A0A330LYB8_9GAMM|nr:hypothetical protein [Shewanella benthica]SQH75359.1 membrane protein of unknown function [Shewanella benthica]
MDWYTIQRNNIFAGIPFFGPLTGSLILIFKEKNYLRGAFLPIFAVILFFVGLSLGITELLPFLDENFTDIFMPYYLSDLLPYLGTICTLGLVFRLTSKNLQSGLSDVALKRGGALGVFLYGISFIFEAAIFTLHFLDSEIFLGAVRFFIAYLLILKPIVTSILFIWFGIIGLFNNSQTNTETTHASTAKKSVKVSHPAVKYFPPILSAILSIGILIWLIYVTQSDNSYIAFYLLFSVACICLSLFINNYQGKSSVVHYKNGQSRRRHYWVLMSSEKRQEIKEDLKLSSITIGANCAAIFFIAFINLNLEFDNYLAGILVFALMFVIAQVTLSTISKTSIEELNKGTIGVGLTLRPFLYIAPCYTVYSLIYAILE